MVKAHRSAARRRPATIEDIYGRFFDRPPAIIYAEVTRPPWSDRALEIAIKAQDQARQELARYPQGERGIAGCLPVPWCDEWLSATPADKERLSDVACLWTIYHHGPAELQHWPALTAHVQKLWALLKTGSTSATRNDARARLAQIYDLVPEDARTHRGTPGADPRDVARRYEALLSRFRLLRKARLHDRTRPTDKARVGSLAPARDALASSLSQLRALIPRATDQELETLVRQLRKPDVPLRDLVNAEIATELRRRPGDLKTVVALGRKLLKGDRCVLARGRAAWAGYDRLVAWCAEAHVKLNVAPPTFDRPR
jgi:hypothetical protein